MAASAVRKAAKEIELSLSQAQNMDRFPTAGHIASWAGLCPGNNESANKRRSGKTRKGNALLRDTLVVCAHSAVKNKSSYFPTAPFYAISLHPDHGSEVRHHF